MYVIWESFGGYKMTNEENYKARIRNERRITTFPSPDFKSAQEVIDYCVKYFGGNASDYKEV